MNWKASHCTGPGDVVDGTTVVGMGTLVGLVAVTDDETGGRLVAMDVRDDVDATDMDIDDDDKIDDIMELAEDDGVSIEIDEVASTDEVGEGAAITTDEVGRIDDVDIDDIMEIAEDDGVSIEIDEVASTDEVGEGAAITTDEVGRIDDVDIDDIMEIAEDDGVSIEIDEVASTDEVGEGAAIMTDEVGRIDDVDIDDIMEIAENDGVSIEIDEVSSTDEVDEDAAITTDEVGKIDDVKYDVAMEIDDVTITEVVAGISTSTDDSETSATKEWVNWRKREDGEGGGGLGGRKALQYAGHGLSHLKPNENVPSTVKTTNSVLSTSVWIWIEKKKEKKKEFIYWKLNSVLDKYWFVTFWLSLQSSFSLIVPCSTLNWPELEFPIWWTQELRTRGVKVARLRQPSLKFRDHQRLDRFFISVTLWKAN